MGDEKQSFVIYRNWMEMIMRLPEDEAIDLTWTLFAYCLGRDDYAPSPVASAIFTTMKPQLDADIKKWYEIRDKRRESGHLGGIANAKQTEANAKQMLPDAKQNEAVYVNVNVNENVNGTVDVNDNGVPSEQPKKEDTIVSKKEPKHKYGMYNNVLLTDTEFDKLKEEFPRDWNERIDRLSEYIESKGAKYKNHLATIRAWARKDTDTARAKKRTPFSVIDDMDFSEPLNSVWTKGVGL